jgi:hypothetical protein
MDPTVQRLVAAGCPVRRINIDRDRALAAQFRVEKIPCFVMLVDGREVDRVVGATSQSRLEQMCEVVRRVSPTVPLHYPISSGSPAATTPPAPPVILARLDNIPKDGPRSWVPVSRESGQPVAPAPSAANAAMLAASVRLRIADADGHSCGTGTIIGSRPGEALVLTCGHIFRDSQGKGRIEVDLFGPHPASRVPGRLVGYDLTRDVGLVLVQTSLPVSAARVAPPGHTIRPGQLVASVGCNNADAPTVQWSEVISLDRFLGPPNIEVAGQPIVGRSGGGLFSADGLVIGVCNAADPGQREGLFAALGSIQAQLDQLGLAGLYAPSRPAGESGRAGNPLPEGPAVAGSPTPRVRMPTPTADAAAPAGHPAPDVALDRGRLTANQQAALDEVRRRVVAGDEVAIVIHGRRNPEATSRVISIDGAPAPAGSGSPDLPHETSLEVPRPRTAILEWDSETGWRHREPIPAPRP